MRQPDVHFDLGHESKRKEGYLGGCWKRIRGKDETPAIAVEITTL